MSRYLIEESIDLNALIQETEDPGSGALVIFVGTVRDHNEGKPVEAVTYEAYRPLAEKALQELEREVLERFGVRRCRIQHRVGHLKLKEPSVAIVIRSAHRGEAFEAAKWAISELKRRVPIWKEEHYVGGGSSHLKGIQLKR